MVSKLYRAISVDDTDTNIAFAGRLETALNRLDEEGYKPEPTLNVRSGNHLVLVGKLKRAPKTTK